MLRFPLLSATMFLSHRDTPLYHKSRGGCRLYYKLRDSCFHDVPREGSERECVSVREREVTGVVPALTLPTLVAVRMIKPWLSVWNLVP